MSTAKHTRGKIDVHHHIFAPFLTSSKLISNEKVGWKTPSENMPWSLENSIVMMDSLGVDRVVLSYPAGVTEKVSWYRWSGIAAMLISAQLSLGDVRKMNEYAHELCNSESSRGRFGWFACLPDLREIEGTFPAIIA